MATKTGQEELLHVSIPKQYIDNSSGTDDSRKTDGSLDDGRTVQSLSSTDDIQTCRACKRDVTWLPGNNETKASAFRRGAAPWRPTVTTDCADMKAVGGR